MYRATASGVVVCSVMPGDQGGGEDQPWHPQKDVDKGKQAHRERRLYVNGVGRQEGSEGCKNRANFNSLINPLRIPVQV
jgi:hypothetical protein